MKSVLGLGTSKEVRVHSQHHKAAGRRPFTHPSVLGDITESARRRRRRGRCCTRRQGRVRLLSVLCPTHTPRPGLPLRNECATLIECCSGGVEHRRAEGVMGRERIVTSVLDAASRCEQPLLSARKRESVWGEGGR